MDTHGKKRIRVLLTKSTLDAHDKGLRYIASVLVDEGMEVVLTRYRICDEVAKVALMEDVDVVGMSFYGSGYLYEVPRVLGLLNENNKAVKFILGGTIPSEDWPKLREWGVNGIFVAGIPTEEVIKCIIS